MIVVDIYLSTLCRRLSAVRVTRRMYRHRALAEPSALTTAHSDQFRCERLAARLSQQLTRTHSANPARTT